MSAQVVEIGKYGQMTRVFVDNKHAFDTAITQIAAAKNIKALLDALQIENVEVRVKEK